MGSTIVVPVGLCIAQAVVGSRDARERVAYTTHYPDPYYWAVNQDISGFDRNNDGLIDEIKVKGLSLSAKFQPFLFSRTYNYQDKEFQELKELLGRKD